MKLNAIGVASSNMKKTVEFYKLLGFEFGEVDYLSDHIEPITPSGSARLMIDSKKLMIDLIGTDPKPSNHSAFALEFDNSKEVDEVAKKIENSGFKVDKQPWDAFWGQRYCVVEDPDGYKIDLYSPL